MESVMKDFSEMQIQYPFSKLFFSPTIEPKPATVTVIAVHKSIIDETNAQESDFTGEYSRELFISIPPDYKMKGCNVFGASWVDLKKIKPQDLHFNSGNIKTLHGYELCVGVPDSFPKMKNVLLENVKTAEMMLIAYRDVMSGVSDKLTIKAYKHGPSGIIQYYHDNNRYKTE